MAPVDVYMATRNHGGISSDGRVQMNSNHLYTASLAKFKAEVKLPNNTANVRVFHLDFELQLRIGTEFNRVTG